MSDAGYNPLFIVTGFMSRYRLRMPHLARTYNRQYTTCSAVLGFGAHSSTHLSLIHI